MKISWETFNVTKIISKQLNQSSAKMETTQLSTKCTMEYYSDIKRNEVLIHATMWMNLTYIILGKTSQTQKAAYCMTPFT